ncbi:hypothetical protein ACFOY2_09170 [Nonomuraea purpurea]|uniref:Uncharacterized protein n=1 Tax=Nonomuraea purpurea TaxID=1849276 RepID=A0ABV8G4X8_9ACTN
MSLLHEVSAGPHHRGAIMGLAIPVVPNEADRESPLAGVESSLSAYGTWELDEEEDELEPPVPSRLGSLGAPQRALADWIGALPAKRKDALLLRVVEKARWSWTRSSSREPGKAVAPKDQKGAPENLWHPF